MGDSPPLHEVPAVQALEVSDFESAWNMHASPWLMARINQSDLRFRELTAPERDAALVKVLRTLETDLVTAGSKRSEDWERGWGENLAEFTDGGNSAALVPKYFSKIPLIRWNQQWIQPEDSGMEYAMLEILLDWVTEAYLTGFDSIYEFGCGTGHHLLRIRERFPEAFLCGLDWATTSQELIRELASSRDDALLTSQHFNYFEPDHEFHLRDGAVALTVASLEQTGRNYREFVEYLLAESPARVINIEPIAELLDDETLLDHLSIRYFRKRNYLEGYYDYLLELQEQGRIVIEHAARTYVGSFFIDGYSLVVWRPVR